MEAIDRRDKTALTTFLSNLPDIDTKSFHGLSISERCAYEDPECIDVVLRCGVRVSDCRDRNGNTGLHVVADTDEDSLVRVLVAGGVDLDERNNLGETALHIAAKAGATRCVGELLRSGARRGIRTVAGETAAEVARNAGHTGLVPILVDLVPLVLNRKHDFIRLACEQKADPNQRDVAGTTPLFAAASLGDPAGVDLLLKLGARAGFKTAAMETALHAAAGATGAPKAPKCISMLCEAGAPINDLGGQGGVAPLHVAVEKGHADAVRALLRAGADVNVSDSRWGLTPLHIAAAKGDPTIVRLLLNAGASKDLADRSGRVPVEVATKQVMPLLAGQGKEAAVEEAVSIVRSARSEAESLPEAAPLRAASTPAKRKDELGAHSGLTPQVRPARRVRYSVSSSSDSVGSKERKRGSRKTRGKGGNIEKSRRSSSSSSPPRGSGTASSTSDSDIEAYSNGSRVAFSMVASTPVKSGRSSQASGRKSRGPSRSSGAASAASAREEVREDSAPSPLPPRAPSVAGNRLVTEPPPESPRTPPRGAQAQLPHVAPQPRSPSPTSEQAPPPQLPTKPQQERQQLGEGVEAAVAPARGQAGPGAEEQASTKIQAAVRGRLARKEVNARREAERAAVQKKLQDREEAKLQRLRADNPSSPSSPRDKKQEQRDLIKRKIAEREGREGAESAGAGASVSGDAAAATTAGGGSAPPSSPAAAAAAGAAPPPQSPQPPSSAAAATSPSSHPRKAVEREVIREMVGSKQRDLEYAKERERHLAAGYVVLRVAGLPVTNPPSLLAVSARDHSGDFIEARRVSVTQPEAVVTTPGRAWLAGPATEISLWTGGPGKPALVGLSRQNLLALADRSSEIPLQNPTKPGQATAAGAGSLTILDCAVPEAKALELRRRAPSASDTVLEVTALTERPMDVFVVVSAGQKRVGRTETKATSAHPGQVRGSSTAHQFSVDFGPFPIPETAFGDGASVPASSRLASLHNLRLDLWRMEDDGEELLIGEAPATLLFELSQATVSKPSVLAVAPASGKAPHGRCAIAVRGCAVPASISKAWGGPARVGAGQGAAAPSVVSDGTGASARPVYEPPRGPGHTGRAASDESRDDDDDDGVGGGRGARTAPAQPQPRPAYAPSSRRALPGPPPTEPATQELVDAYQRTQATGIASRPLPPAPRAASAGAAGGQPVRGRRAPPPPPPTLEDDQVDPARLRLGAEAENSRTDLSLIRAERGKLKSAPPERAGSTASSPAAPPVSASARQPLPSNERGPELVQAVRSGKNDAVERLLLVEGTNPNFVADDAHTTVLHAAAESNNVAALGMLLKAGANVNPVDYLGNSPLHLAVDLGFVAASRVLVEAGVPVNTINKKGSSALHMACARGDGAVPDLAPLLVRAGAQVNVPDRLGHTPLMIAARAGSLPLVQYLLSVGAAKEMQSRQHLTALQFAVAGAHREVADLLRMSSPEALMAAVCTGNFAKVKTLLQSGVDCNWSESGSTVLIEAAKTGNVGLVQLLVKAGAFVNLPNSTCTTTPLHTAALHGRAEVVDFLVKHGASTHWQDPAGATPLHAAAQSCSSACLGSITRSDARPNEVMDQLRTALHLVALHARSDQEGIETAGRLLAVKASAEAEDSHGKTARDYAAERGLLGLASLLTPSGPPEETLMNHVVRGARAEVESTLQGSRRAQLEINSRIRDTTYLHEAARGGDVPLLQVLLDMGAVVSVEDSAGRTALHVAAEAGHEETVSFLLRSGAQINAIDIEGRTALHYSVLRRQKGTFKLLMAGKAAINLQDSAGYTALMYAAQIGDALVVKALMAAGARKDIVATLPHAGAGGGSHHEAAGSSADTTGGGATPASNHPANAAAAAAGGGIGGAASGAAGGEAAPPSRSLRQHQSNQQHHYGRAAAAPPPPPIDALRLALQARHTSCVTLLMSTVAKDDETFVSVVRSATAAAIRDRLQEKAVHDTINQLGETGTTPLHEAARMRAKDVISALLEAGCDPEVPDADGATALHYASSCSNASAAGALIGAGAKVNAKDNQGKTPLHAAAKNSDLMISVLLVRSGAAVNAVDLAGETALMAAASVGSMPVVKVLLRAGANRDVVSARGQTALGMAKKAGHDAIARVLTGVELLNNPTAPAAAGASAAAPPAPASALDKSKSSSNLLGSDNPDKAWGLALEDQGDALIEAVKLDDPIYVQRLLGAGADPNRKARSTSSTPLHEACAIENYEVMQMLLRAGANPNAVDDEQDTPLMLVARSGFDAGVTLLLDKGADPWIANRTADTALHIFSRLGKTRHVERLLEHQTSFIDAQDGDDCTPLMLACAGGHEATVRLLRAKGARIDPRNHRGETAFGIALRCEHRECAAEVAPAGALVESVRGNDLRLAKDLLQNGFNAGAHPPGEETTALHEAAGSGKREFVRMLLKTDKSLAHRRNGRGQQPLHLACRTEHIGIVEDLLNAGSDVGARDELGRVPLHYAAGQGQQVIAELLLQRSDSDPNARDYRGNTPLICAAEGNFPSLVSTLLAMGAKRGMANEAGLTAFRTAASLRHHDCVAILADDAVLVDAVVNDDLDDLERLLLGGVDPNLRDAAGAPALHQAVALGAVDHIRVLIERGADVGLADREGSTAVHIGCCTGHLEAVRILASHGASLTLSSRTLATPLHAAVANKHNDIVRFLLEERSGAVEVDALNARGETPLVVAATVGNEGAVRLLLDAGADRHLMALEPGLTDKSAESALKRAWEHGHHRVYEMLSQDTPVIQAVKSGDHRQLAALLKGQPGCHSKPDPAGVYPIHHAVRCGDKRALAMLLAAGASAKAADRDGMSALHWACESGEEACARLLIEHGASVNARDKSGRTPILVLCSAGPAAEPDQFTFANSEATEGVIIGGGRRPGGLGASRRSVTPPPGVIAALVLAGADLNLRDRFGNLPLHCAAALGNRYHVATLLRCGSLVNNKRHDGRTAHMLAARDGFKKITDLLTDPELIAPVVKPGASAKDASVSVPFEQVSATTGSSFAPSRPSSTVSRPNTGRSTRSGGGASSPYTAGPTPGEAEVLGKVWLSRQRRRQRFMQPGVVEAYLQSRMGARPMTAPTAELPPAPRSGPQGTATVVLTPRSQTSLAMLPPSAAKGETRPSTAPPNKREPLQPITSKSAGPGAGGAGGGGAGGGLSGELAAPAGPGGVGGAAGRPPLPPTASARSSSGQQRASGNQAPPAQAWSARPGSGRSSVDSQNSRPGSAAADSLPGLNPRLRESPLLTRDSLQPIKRAPSAGSRSKDPTVHHSGFREASLRFDDA